MSEEYLADEEVVFRRIPPGTQWFEPPDRISSFNFKLKAEETGLSVYRQAVVNPAEVLAKPEVIAGSLLTFATVGQIRSLTNAKGDPLKLDVVACDDFENPGHAEIRGPDPGKLASGASKALKKLFKLVDI